MLWWKFTESGSRSTQRERNELREKIGANELYGQVFECRLRQAAVEGCATKRQRDRQQSAVLQD